LADALLRPAPVYSLVGGEVGAKSRTGSVYAYDRPNARIVAVDKSSGAYMGQYRLAGGVQGWDDMRDFYVVPGAAEAPATVFWLSKNGLHQAVLEGVPDVAPSPAPSPAVSASPAAPSKAP
jgi:hypothetical protein